jgi:LysM repeat protein
MKKILFLFIVFIPSFLFSQIEKSTETEIYNGKTYYIHEVQQGHTVYSIAKAYGVTTDAVFEVNAFARDGIQIGQLLRIPITKTETTEHISKPDSISQISIEKFDTTTTEAALQKSRNEPHISSNDTAYYFTYVAPEDILISQLAQSFHLSTEDLIKHNDQFKNKEIIRKNDVLRFVVANIEPLIDYVLKNPNAQVIVLVSHIVSRGETLFAIGRNYGCTVNDLMMFNPGLSETLQPEQTLWVPAKEQYSVMDKTDRKPEPECKQISEKKTYNVALLVPFYLDKAGSISTPTENRRQQRRNNPKSFQYIQFYEGFAMALETIQFNNASINLHVYDVTDGEEKIKTLINRGVLDVDLIIGPFFRKPLELLSTWAIDKDIKIVDLYMPDEIDYVFENPNLISAIPSITEQLKGLITHLNQIPTETNIIVTYNTNNNEKLLADKMKEIQQLGDEFNPKIQYMAYGSGGMSALVKMLSKEKQNIIISFTNNEVFLNNFTRSLFDYAEEYPITLIGLPSWLRFESIEMRYLTHFNTHFFSSHFVDYSKENVKEFVHGFQKTYNTDPDRMAFLGYDVASYFLGALSFFGKDFVYCTEQYKVDLLSANFNIQRISGEHSQWHNLFVSIYEMIDYQLFDVRRFPKPHEE